MLAGPPWHTLCPKCGMHRGLHLHRRLQAVAEDMQAGRQAPPWHTISVRSTACTDLQAHLILQAVGSLCRGCYLSAAAR